MENMTFAVCLPLIFYIMILIILMKKSRGFDWRHVFLISATLWGAFVVLVTEVLSIFDGISYYPLSLAWLGGIGFEILLLVVLKDKQTAPMVYDPWDSHEIALISGIVFILSIVGLTAISSPPNTIDSLSYHMSRVMYWVQNQNIYFYPTHILRQLHQAPWAEFAILQFQVLAGNDRFANLVQWFSMAGSLVGVSSIASQMRMTRKGQLLTSLFVATIPMGIAQGSSAQNDYVLAFWLVCFCYFILLLKSHNTLTNIVLCGISLGLSFLTKATAYLYAPPFILLGSYLLLRPNWKRGLLNGTVIVLMVLILNVGHWLRCYELYGNPLGPGRESPYSFIYTNDIFSTRVLVSNVIRNVAIHLGTPYPRVNAFFENGVEEIHTLIGISSSDPRTTWSRNVFHIWPVSTSEDFAGNLLHTISVIGCCVYLAVNKNRNWSLILYSVCLLSGFLLFCGVLRWQLWNSRLHLPLFVLGCVVMGWVVSRFPDKLQIIFVAALFVGSFPWLFLNQGRPIFAKQNVFNVSYMDQYFSYIQPEKASYVEAVKLLSDRQCSSVGFISDWENWEYPIWVLFKQYSHKPVRIEHVKVNNISEQISNRNVHNNFKPCGIILRRDNPPQLLTLSGVDYFRIVRGYLSVYTP